MSQRRLWLWVLCAGLAVSVGACGVRRELIASQGPIAVPFSFPYVDPAIPDAPGQFGGGPRRSDGRPAHRLSARRRDARAQHRPDRVSMDARRRREPRVPDPAGRRPRALRLLRPLHAGDLPLPDARARLAGDRLRAPRRHAAGDDRRHRRRGRLGLSIAGDRRALLARAGDGRPLLLDRDEHGGEHDGRHDVPAAVRCLAGVALHRAVVADQPAARAVAATASAATAA